ncbi:MAG: hypothetical protein ACI9UA_002762 [Pseudoalteromonas tetraodonis]|jgi:hypothetical protein
MNSPKKDDGSHLRESAGDGAELARAVRISLCGIELGRPASFLPESLATADFDWQAWLRDAFAEDIGPAFVEMFQAAGAMQVKELMRADRWLKGESSRAAGASLLARLREAKKMRVVERMHTLLDGDEGPHFATAFAVECAEFHLPLRTAIVSYLYGEWRCGMSSLDQRGDLEAFAAAGGEVILKVVGAVLARNASPFDHAAGL